MKYISWSEYSLFYRDRTEYYKRYILGIQTEPTEPMIIGQIIHQALKEDWNHERLIEEFKKNYITPNYWRICSKFLDIEKPKKRELKLEADLGDYTILGYLDGYEDGWIIEYKTSKSHWTQERAEKHGQLSMYSLLAEQNGLKVIGCKLYSLNTSNGTIKSFITKPTEFKDRLDTFYNELKQLGWWEKRI